MPYSSRLYLSQQVKTGERESALFCDMEMYQLMENAGECVFSHMKRLFPNAKTCLVVCGGGNNGGDGYIVARLAMGEGIDVELWHVGDADTLTGDALIAQQAYLAAGGKISSPRISIADASNTRAVDVVIDAILGIGLVGAVRSNVADVIETINQSDIPVIAVDVPSGLCADTGRCLGRVIKAQYTVTFIGIKAGLVTGLARNYTGEIIYAPLGCERGSGKNFHHYFHRQNEPFAHIITSSDIILPKRKPTAHKGHHGKALLIGGDEGMGGAIILAGKAALRGGAGLVATCCDPFNITPVLISSPEIMASSWLECEKLKHRMEWCDVIAIGPGLGLSAHSKIIYEQVELTSIPVVYDADALTMLAHSPSYRSNRILTPHPSEAARLLDITVNEIEANRYQATKAIQQQYGGVVILKGAGTLVFDGDNMYVSASGNSGMASGGMGDALTGIVTALVAQGFPLMKSAIIAVEIHARAGDLAAKQGQRGLVASDLMPHIRALVNAS
ncbi:NAD(P)H-hydrate dehydratase [Vibrio sinensis]|uniref:Bifunctional NAD(P)H-hydrate repair enzyme n=1 Tax=Vibrio sinensis TaxID=2302434 RepID=A0A3A6QZD2_9VIBR|nr:NAD(P)H-hydrate dehydratase [Vibrio sinensis]RJX68921.1 NAD(P)H-hydrate dehydratase [Vibrio sinensis]